VGILTGASGAPASVVCAALVASLGLLWAAPVRAQVALGEVGHVIGDSDARVRVVAFTDFACGACGEFARDTFDEVRTTLVESGRVVWRQVPFMLGFRRGREATLAAECAADQGAFWAMHDALFADQDRWRGGRHPDEEFAAMAIELGLDVEVFRHCVDRNTPRRRIDASNDAADELRVRATPAFYIDGRPVLGALSIEQFTALVEAAEAVRAGGGDER
jgi:protein-disulfide isomerase